MIRLFERPIAPGWVYPCTLDDIAGHLAALPAADAEGLWAVGLVPSTRKDQDADGRYFCGERPTIHLFSYPDTFRFKLAPHSSRGRIEHVCRVPLAFGMRLEREGSRYVCAWSPADLRRYMLDHVLLHEVGHHVHYQERHRQGICKTPGRTASEQFAEDYALRYRRRSCFRSHPGGAG